MNRSKKSQSKIYLFFVITFFALSVQSKSIFQQIQALNRNIEVRNQSRHEFTKTSEPHKPTVKGTVALGIIFDIE